MKILDCTIRDGGYYTGWSFDEFLVKNTVRALNECGIDMCELGYVSSVKEGRFGDVRNLDLQFDHDLAMELVFMIDLKELIDETGSLDLTLAESYIEGTTQMFSCCRLATTFELLDQSLQMTALLKSAGLKVALNFMYASEVSNDHLQAIREACSGHVDFVYLADSFGALFPNDVEEKIAILKSGSYQVGIHLHDNTGMAFANALRAIECGIDIIDATITGMGRGVGNLKTEQLLTYLQVKNDEKTSIVPLISVLKDFRMSQREYEWGWDVDYMITGLRRQHPNSAVNLRTEGVPLRNSLEALLGDCSAAYNPIEDAIVIIPARYASTRFPAKPLAKISGIPMVVRVAQIAIDALGPERVYVATDHSKIKGVVETYGINCIMTSENCNTGTDRVAEAWRLLGASHKFVVNLQGDEPTVLPEMIRDVIRELYESQSDVVNCYTDISSDEEFASSNSIKMVMGCDESLLYASRAAIPAKKNAHDLSEHRIKQVSIYGFTPGVLSIYGPGVSKTAIEEEEDIEILRAIEMGFKVKMKKFPHVTIVSVDEPHEIKNAEEALASRE